MINKGIKFRKEHKDKSTKGGNVLENELLSLSHRQHRTGQVLFAVMVVIAVGVVAFNLWAYVINP